MSEQALKDRMNARGARLSARGHVLIVAVIMRYDLETVLEVVEKTVDAETYRRIDAELRRGLSARTRELLGRDLDEATYRVVLEALKP